MRSFKYVGDCAAGFVEFTFPQGAVHMPKDESVQVPDALAAKLEKNGAFVEVKAEAKAAEAPKAEKKAKGEK